MVKFNKYNVQANGLKVRVWYSLDNRGDNRKCVKLYAKDYGYALGKIFPNEHENNSDVRSDYFEKSSVILFEDHPQYAAARAKVEALAAEPKSVVWSLV